MAKQPRLRSGKDQAPPPPPAPGRVPTGQFAAGVSGNPGGRPKTNEEFVAAAREISLVALKKLAQIMMSGTGPAQVRAAEIIIERAWGKAAQPNDGGQLPAGTKRVIVEFEPERPLEPEPGDDEAEADEPKEPEPDEPA
jgi:hypothetical protein